jgi:hypothetical protein
MNDYSPYLPRHVVCYRISPVPPRGFAPLQLQQPLPLLAATMLSKSPIFLCTLGRKRFYPLAPVTTGRPRLRENPAEPLQAGCLLARQVVPTAEPPLCGWHPHMMTRTKTNKIVIYVTPEFGSSGDYFSIFSFQGAFACAKK